MWALFESNSTPEIADIIATVIAQNLYVGGNNPAACSSQKCFNGVFNFMAAYSQGQGKLFDGPNSTGIKMFAKNNPGLGGEAEVRSLVFSLGAHARNSTRVVGDRYNGPSNWGNIKGADTLADPDQFHIPVAPAINGTAPNTIYYLNPNFIVYSINQRKYFEPLGVDFSFDP
jgi:hypothetical protein